MNTDIKVVKKTIKSYCRNGVKHEYWDYCYSDIETAIELMMDIFKLSKRIARAHLFSCVRYGRDWTFYKKETSILIRWVNNEF